MRTAGRRVVSPASSPSFAVAGLGAPMVVSWVGKEGDGGVAGRANPESQR